MAPSKQSAPPPIAVPQRSSSFGSHTLFPPSEPPPPLPSRTISLLTNSLNSKPDFMGPPNDVPSPIAFMSSQDRLQFPANKLAQPETSTAPYGSQSNRIFLPSAPRPSASCISLSTLPSPPPSYSSRRRQVPNRVASASTISSPALSLTSPALRPSVFPPDRPRTQTGYSPARTISAARSMSSLRHSPHWVSEGSGQTAAPFTVPGPEPVAKPAAESEKQTDRLVVGVDFGTTYSAVAAVYSATPDEIDIIKTWPGGNGITSDKVPTEIGYFDAPAAAITSPTRSDSQGRAIKWGFQFKPEDNRFRCIKLFLDHNQRLPHFVSREETESKLESLGISVVDVVSTYLTKIYDHTVETLTKRYGSSFMERTPLEFVLTVPAVWSDAAKAATLQAAERAGMGNRHELRLISEPEAAAVYTLRAIQPNELKVGDNFIVCDAGGGTVDLIAYTILQLDPLRVEESAVGDGGLCGSAFLNYRFEQQVERILGKDRYKTLRSKKPKSWNMGLKYFEEFVKRNYNDNQCDSGAEEVCVPFPGLPDDEPIGLADGFLTMNHGQIKAIFDPVVADVISLVQTQADRIRSKGGSVSGIILVGGFGQSNYLFHKMREHFKPVKANTDDSTATKKPNSLQTVPSYSEFPTPPSLQLNGVSTNGAHPPIEVMHPMYAWTAVVRGAVIRGLEGGMVISRKSRCFYGTSYATVYDERAHDVGDRYWSPLWERWMVSDRMQWHISKGQQLSENEPISFHYTRNFRPGQSLLVTDDLLACFDDSPPSSCRGAILPPVTKRASIETKSSPSMSASVNPTHRSSTTAAPPVLPGLPATSSPNLSISSTLNSTSSPMAEMSTDVSPPASDDVLSHSAPPMTRRLQHVCTLKTDLAAVPKHHFTRLTTTSGIEFDNLDFALNMRVQSAGLVFDLTVGGVKYGSVVAEFRQCQ